MHPPLALMIALARGPAPGQPDPTAGLELSWQAPADCPDAAGVRGRIATLLASVDAQGAARTLRVRGEVTPGADVGVRLALRIDAGGGEEERELVGADCREVTEAAALIVAMTLQPSVAGSIAPPPSEPATIPEPDEASAEPGPSEQDPPPRAAPAPVEATRSDAPARGPAAARADGPRRRLPWRVGAEIEGGVGLGPLPGASGVVAAAFGIRGPWVRVDATGASSTPRRSDARDRGVRAQLWSVGVRGCGVPRAGRVEVPLCGGVVAGLMHAAGVGSEVLSQRASSPWAAAIASATLVVRVLPWLGLRIGAEGHVAFARPAFHTEPSGTQVHRAAAGGVAVRAGLEFDFEVP